ncbi:MAG: IS5 family transposase [Tropicimonas sp.]|uniref:IS5 family transposase n=1 Tax=Tropicimonas sp. TaxID=2067044 RepID=UPI003A8B78F2
MDATGLRVTGQSGWLEEKHGDRKGRKTWRKRHVGLDPQSGEIVASLLTTEHVGDPSALPDLLRETGCNVARFIADGAYDGQPVHDVIKAHCGPDVEIIIPPPANAISGSYAVRDAHIETIREKGCMGWQGATGYNQRSRIEAQIGRYKRVIGDTLRARKMETQTNEATIAIKALNRMTRLGRAQFQRVS